MAIQPQFAPLVVAGDPGDAMNRAREVPWFNPREMTDEQVLALSTGRSALLAEFHRAVQHRLAEPGTFKHWLITGMRGAGKSFFLRLVQATFTAHHGQAARFVLLPEEHRNIYAPHEFLTEIERLLADGQQNPGQAPAWRVDDTGSAWNAALSNLLTSLGSSPLLVVGVENFDVLLAQAFADATDNSRLRHLMSNEPRIMLLATAVRGDFDENYDQRLFRQFEHHCLPPWNPQDHRDYLSRRAEQQRRVATERQLARIDAYSRYTGGNARAAAILAATLLDEADPLAGAMDLDAAIEKMSDYYRNLIERVPINTRKLLDALIRGGEPASQTEVAHRTGANANEISRAFTWLVDNGYVSESRLKGEKSKQYRVLDRLFVQFYRMRSIHPGQRSKLAVMADLVADTLSFPEKWHWARHYAGVGETDEAFTLAELALKEKLVDIQRLPSAQRSLPALLDIGGAWEQHEAIRACKGVETYKRILATFPTDEALRLAMARDAEVVRAIHRGKARGDVLVPLLVQSLSLSPCQKYGVIATLIDPSSSELKWGEYEKIFTDEIAEFEKLRPTEGVTIIELERLREIGHEFPRTLSLMRFAEWVVEGTDFLQSLGTVTAASWAAEAAQNWAASGFPDLAESSTSTCLTALQKLIDEEYNPSLALTIISQTKIPETISIQQRANIWEIAGFAKEQLDDYSGAYQSFSQAIQALGAEGPATMRLWNQEKMAWCLGQQGKAIEAVKLHQQLVAEWMVEKDSRGRDQSITWNIGQIARHTATLQSVAAAWQVLDKHFEQFALAEVKEWAVRQLGDAVADVVRQHDIRTGFALGCEVLTGLAERPALPAEACLRGLWIDMVEMAVPHELLSDLLHEWPRIFASNFAELAPLHALLLEWLSDLNTPAAEREARHKTLDPDLVTTLVALAEGLSRKTKARLGFGSKPASTNNADNDL